MTDPNARRESSKEEILASIRKVVSERSEAPPSGEADESGILDLTQEVRDDGSVVDLHTGATVVEGAGMTAEDNTPGTEAEGGAPEDSLLGAEAETAASAAFASVAEVAAALESSRKSGAKSIETAAKEVMRPMIRAWLDANLPGIVERLVQREIERLARRGESATDP